MAGIVIEKFVDKSTKKWRERYQIFWPDGGFSEIDGITCRVKWSDGRMVDANNEHRLACREVLKRWRNNAN